ncbi:MAG TPA: fumarylacetoacetate hydrolase family protein [Acidimicrobiales bacterium]|nr:fumarylacetoacetate hydrolase family protein [Acidimicrobiales bacterium]
MRLVSFRSAGTTRAGRVEGDQIVELPFADVGALLASGPDWADAARSDGPVHPYVDIRLAPVVVAPPKIICLGLNYADHIAEMGHARPKHPTLFAKYARSLIGHRDAIELPAVSDNVDYEAEMAFVIGHHARHVSEADGLDAIAGWAVLNDVSVRDWQRRTSQFLSGKTFEHTTPVGPELVTRDEGSDDGLGLAITCEVDGETLQSGNTRELIFSPAWVVSYLSTIMTLEPGDLVATGTPAGVAAGRTPPPWLRDGQTVTVTVEGIGRLENPCRQSGPGTVRPAGDRGDG